MNAASEILLMGGVLLAFYLLICNRVVAAIHPLRMRFANLGAHLLANPELGPLLRRRVNMSLNHAYSTPTAWGLAIAVPFAAIATIKDEVVGNNPDADLEHLSEETRDDLRLFCSLWFVSVIANSPLAAAVVALELFIVLITWLPVSKTVIHAIRAVMSIELGASDVARAAHARMAG